MIFSSSPATSEWRIGEYGYVLDAVADSSVSVRERVSAAECERHVVVEFVISVVDVVDSASACLIESSNPSNSDGRAAEINF